MEKEKYVKPTCRAILLTHRMQLLAGSGSYNTVTEIATLVSVSLFEKADLKELLTAPKEKINYLKSNQNVNELTLF